MAFQGNPLGFLTKLNLSEVFALRELLTSDEPELVRRARVEAERMIRTRLDRMPPDQRDRVLAAWAEGARVVFGGSAAVVRGTGRRRRAEAGQLVGA